MLDINIIRENPDIVRNDLKRRQDSEKLKWVDDLLKKDEEWRKLTYKIQELRHKRNSITKEINELRKQGKDIKEKVAESKKIPQDIKDSEDKLEQLKEKIQYYVMRLPNILHESVPEGGTEEDNVTVKEWGKKPKFDFELKSHVDVIEALDLVDLERAAKISGSRFFFLKNELVMMDLALKKLALDLLMERGYNIVEPPLMIRKKPYEGVTDLADFEDVLYKIEGEDLYLIATSEHAIAAMHMDETLDEEKLPLKYAGISPCFRKEAGAHGKDTKGIFRVHQFNKIEQFIFSTEEQSWGLHEELLKNAEDIFQKLELPYRIVNICTADIGSVAAKKYDIEVWMPAQNAYREVVSCSNCTDYQARRLNIRYGKEGGKKEVAHTLNSTAIATSRAIVAIIENYQNKDGSISVPKALQPYMNGMKKIVAKKK